MRESLNGGLFLWNVMSVKGHFDSRGELVWEILTKSNNQIDYFSMHMRKVQKRPQFL